MQIITNKMSREFVCEKLRTDKLWIKKALLLVYNNQKFSDFDSKFLSSVAIQLKRLVEYNVVNSGLKEVEAIRRVNLSDRQYEALKRIMPKYWKCVFDSCEQEKLKKLISKDV